MNHQIYKPGITNWEGRHVGPVYLTVDTPYNRHARRSIDAEYRREYGKKEFIRMKAKRAEDKAKVTKE